jgi:hypothetical protein
MPRGPTYWVRSRQINETETLNGSTVPVKFKSLESAKRLRRELNLRRGPYHPGYFVEVQEAEEDGPSSFGRY